MQKKLLYTIKNSCKPVASKVEFTGSPLFPDNKKRMFVELSKRSPASINPSAGLIIKKNKSNLAENIESKKYIWKISYLSGSSRISEVFEVNKKTKKTNTFRLFYQSGALFKIIDSDRNQIEFFSTGSKISKVNYAGDKNRVIQNLVKIRNLNQYKEGI